MKRILVPIDFSDATPPVIDLARDLMVMGNNGHGAMYNLLVGSATKGVLKHSARPVLLVPASRS